MQSRYFCAFHAEKLKQCEAQAIGSWSQMMHRGVHAYAEHRASEALIYLGTALEIGILRSHCPTNDIFCSMQLLKPAEFLIEIMLSHDHYENANALLCDIGDRASIELNQSSPLKEGISKLFARVETAEKAYFTGEPTITHATRAPIDRSGLQQNIHQKTHYSLAKANKNHYH